MLTALPQRRQGNRPAQRRAPPSDVAIARPRPGGRHARRPPLWCALVILCRCLIVAPLHGAKGGTEPPDGGVASEPLMETHEHDHDHDHGEEHHDEPPAAFSEPELERYGIHLSSAAPGELTTTLSLPGQIVLNGDRLAHVVPRVGGVVREVRRTLGEHVRQGEVLAVIDSRELAEARAAYLAARERAALAEVTFRRKETLWNERITSEQFYQEARQALALARVEEHASEQKLIATGVTLGELNELTRHSLESLHPREALGRYEITAPFPGTLIERHVALGEAVQPDASVFVLGDLTTVWADISLFPKDLPRVRVGQVVRLSGEPDREGQGRIIHVQPVINPETRRTFARILLDNRDGRWQPGLFVTGHLTTAPVRVALRVPSGALQTIRGETVVFVRHGHGFEPRPVVVGRSDEHYSEIVSGLRPGETYAEAGAFLLKAELQKGEAGHEH